MAGSLVILVDFEIKDGMLGEFMPVMEANARNSLQLEPGCRQFDVMTVEGKPNGVFLYEVYDDEAAFQEHRKMPHIAEFLGKIRPMVVSQKVTRAKRTAVNLKP